MIFHWLKKRTKPQVRNVGAASQTSHSVRATRPQGRRQNKRLIVERLESRQLMAGDLSQNPDWSLDVNSDTKVTPVDALYVINFLQGSNSSGEGETSNIFIDVNGDQIASPVDALMVINYLNNMEGEPPPPPPPPKTPPPASDPTKILSTTDVDTLLARAAVASPSNDAIIAVVDRNGRILGVRTEQGVVNTYAGREADLIFAIDGAVAKARTAAYFSNSEAPLTSRTIRFISQSTVTQREVESNPNIQDLNSTERGPGFVAPIGLGGHFPPEVAFTPPVDLFAIEHQSRDSALVAGANLIKEVGDEVLNYRFDANINFVPSVEAKFFLEAFPESYGVQSGRLLTATSRGIATLPGGVPLYKEVAGGIELVGGIGVFFPGEDGYATFEQGFVHASQMPGGVAQTEKQRTNAARVLESEFIAMFAASGGGTLGPGSVSFQEFEGIAPALPAEFVLPFGRIDLVGITLEIYGPTPTRDNPVSGPNAILQVGRRIAGGTGAVTGQLQRVSTNPMELVQRGVTVPEEWLVLPHASAVDPNLTAAEVERIITQGFLEANTVRAAIRLDANFKPGPRTKMVFAVTDSAGEVLGLFRMKDATVFSVDVAVAKARNTSYYASDRLKVVDQVELNTDADNLVDVAKGTAFTNRTFRFLALPRFPTGAENGNPGDFSVLRNPGINPLTGENLDPNNPLAASVYSSDSASVVAFASFNPARNFRDTLDYSRQNGIVFFPGSTPLYRNQGGTYQVIGGFGVSGDGVDQDDVVTAAGQVGFAAPAELRSDQIYLDGVQLPFQKYLRNPRG